VVLRVYLGSGFERAMREERKERFVVYLILFLYVDVEGVGDGVVGVDGFLAHARAHALRFWLAGIAVVTRFRLVSCFFPPFCVVSSRVAASYIPWLSADRYYFFLDGFGTTCG
jgi:hypothetical protein